MVPGHGSPGMSLLVAWSQVMEVLGRPWDAPSWDVPGTSWDVISWDIPGTSWDVLSWDIPGLSLGLSWDIPGMFPLVTCLLSSDFLRLL